MEYCITMPKMLHIVNQNEHKEYNSLLHEKCSIPHLYGWDQMRDRNNISFLLFDSVCEQDSPSTSRDPTQPPPTNPITTLTNQFYSNDQLHS
jgi:hypothetical protein